MLNFQQKRSFLSLLDQVQPVEVRAELKGRIFILVDDLSDEKRKHDELLERAKIAEEKLVSENLFCPLNTYH